MEISERDYEKMVAALQEIRRESRREKIRKNRISNLADRVSLTLRKAQRRTTLKTI